MVNEHSKRNRIGQSTNDNMFSVLNYSLLFIALVVVLYPLIFVLSASMSSPEAAIKGDIWLLPKDFNLQAYARVFQNQNIMNGYWNTIMYTVAGTALNLVLTVAAAYPLSRKDMKGRNVMMMYLVFTMFFSGGLIPTYLIIKGMGIMNTFWVIILPNAVSVFNIVIMRTFFQSTIPIEVQEASIMDGCSNMSLLLRIVLPLSMPVIAVMILFYSVGHWNAYFNALIYLSDRDKYPLQIILREILIQNEMQEMMELNNETSTQQALLAATIKYAVIIVTNLPVLLLYPFLQRYFVKGVMIGAIKG
jgi:putative aldouronate transport system permease protein